MKWWIWIVFILQLVNIFYGLYNEFAPTQYPFRLLPPGMGFAVTLIAATMAVTLAVVQTEYQERREEQKAAKIWDQFAGRISFCVSAHEREFYSLLAIQISAAQNNVDVTHLGPRPPQFQHGKEEARYFEDLKKVCKASRAQIRRVERLTPDKIPWIKKLAQDFSGVKNFSMRVYKDPFDTEMPAAVSVCRIDNKYAWIVAMAEHESTANYRDFMITGPDGVDIIRRYFQERLWNRGREIMTYGNLKDKWEDELIL